MAFAHFLAMTSAEFDAAPSLPTSPAWMACHFSPYATGLSNLPQHLPEGSLLILNDRTPIGGHDPQRICSQLKAVVTANRCYGLLLDFQRPGSDETEALTQVLCSDFPCPVAVTPEYHQAGAAVFLPPVPVNKPPEDYLAPWRGNTIWLELALSGAEILLSPAGAQILPDTGSAVLPLTEKALFCHYRIEASENAANFHLRRTPQDLQALMQRLPELGVAAAVGLFQELGTSGIF